MQLKTITTSSFRKTKRVNSIRNNCPILLLACCPVSKNLLISIGRELTKYGLKPLLVDITKHYFQIINILKASDKSVLGRIKMLFKELVNNAGTHICLQIINQIKPSVIVLGDDGGICATAIRYAKLLKIPTVAVQVGVLSKPNYVTFFDNLLKLLRIRKYMLWKVLTILLRTTFLIKIICALKVRLPNLEWGSSDADYYVVWSNHYANFIKERLLSPAKIFVTGNPLIRKSNLSILKENVEKGGESPKNILILTQPLMEDKYCHPTQYQHLIISTIVASMLALRNIESLTILIKPHPREDPDKYKNIVEIIRRMFASVADKLKVEFLSKDMVIYEALSKADLCITYASTSGLYVLAQGIPLITISLPWLPYHSIFEGYQYNVPFTTSFHAFKSQFTMILRRLLKDYRNSNFKQEAARFLDVHWGVSSIMLDPLQKIASLVYNLHRKVCGGGRNNSK